MGDCKDVANYSESGHVIQNELNKIHDNVLNKSYNELPTQEFNPDEEDFENDLDVSS
jgi:hypothetical protein